MIDQSKQSCWANIPQELLRDVLMRIEESDENWPERKNVVVCACVCRSWREITKEIVKSPEMSGKLTFPISLKQPGWRSSLHQCYIKRNRSSQTYYLYLGLNQASMDDGKFLLAARKCRRPTYTDYIISLSSDEVSKESNGYIGKLRSNFMGTKYIVFDVQPSTSGIKFSKSRSTRIRQISPNRSTGTHPVAHISYDLNVLGSRGPRRMQCLMNPTPASSPKSFSSSPFFRSKSSRSQTFQSGVVNDQNSELLALRNKTPRWHEHLRCWCLNFNGRVTVASVKNFQLVASLEDENVILQFGKVGTDVFTMDYQYPISAFQAFAICLSSFDTKIACE